MQQLTAELILNGVAGAAGTVAGRVAALNHKVIDYAMKGKAVIKALFGQRNKILRRFRCIVCCQLHLKIAHACVKNRCRRLCLWRLLLLYLTAGCKYQRAHQHQADY